jgi:hypothetical protein
MISLTQQQRPGVGSDPRIRLPLTGRSSVKGLPQLDRAIERGLKQPSVAFTHEVLLPFRGPCVDSLCFTRRNGPRMREKMLDRE